MSALAPIMSATGYPTHDGDGYPLAGPHVGDKVWIKWEPDLKTGGHYRKIVELVGWTEDEPARLKFRAADPDGTLHLMAVSLPEFQGTRTLAEVRAARRPRTHRTASEQRDIDNGSKCRAKGHDLTGLMPNGKPALYVAPNGAKLCQQCRAEGAAKRKELASAKS